MLTLAVHGAYLFTLLLVSLLSYVSLKNAVWFLSKLLSGVSWDTFTISVSIIVLITTLYAILSILLYMLHFLHPAIKDFYTIKLLLGLLVLNLVLTPVLLVIGIAGGSN